MGGPIHSNPTSEDEIALLRQQLADAEQRAAIYEATFQQTPLSIAIWKMEDLTNPRSFQLVDVNPPNIAATGFDIKAEIGRSITEIFPAIPEMFLEIYANVVHNGQPHNFGEITVAGSDSRMGGQMLTIQALPLPNNHLCVLVENITERKRAEILQQQISDQLEMIQAQQVELVEISTPLIPINDQVVVMPLIGSVDPRRAQQVLETLLQGIAASSVRFAILDITGVTVVDTQVANALLHAAQAVRLLGAQVVLTGIRPEVAQTLVGLGADLRDIVTRGTLQSGIAYTVSAK